MSNGEGRKVSLQDIQLVQNLIERCLQLYMSQKEVMNTLLLQAKIETGFTELLWQKLEAENPEFFKAYYLRLIAKDQILRFNQLLDRQIQLMRQLYPAAVAPIPLSDGSQNYPRIIQGMMKSEASHADDPRFMFGADRNLQYPNTTKGVGVESNSQASNETFLEHDMKSIGLLGQISQNFSFSDLTAGFSNITDILSYTKSPFLGKNANLMDRHIRGEQDSKRLDSISDGFSYADLGSD